MLTASDLHAEYGDNTIFEDLSLTLSGDRRVGLVGPNGAGKTTLLRLLAGVDAPERGAVALGPGDRIGYLPQEPPGAELTIDRLLGAALGEVWRLHGELERLESRLDDPAALARYGEAQERFGALGGWALQAQLDGARAALGIAHVPLDAPLGSLSGGEAARALLAGVLLARPTILLLDEPTNHLDLDGLDWLEEFLTGFPGAVLVVSHDRRFLDTTVSQILELDVEGLTLYEGGYTRLPRREGAPACAARARLRGPAEAAAAARGRHHGHARLRQADREHGRAASARTSSSATPRRWRRRRSRASGGCRRSSTPRATSRSRATRPALKIELDGGGGGRLVAALRGVTAGWDDPLLRDVDLTVHGRDRIAITGPNGAGKTTLLALLQGELAPMAGAIDRPVRAAVLPQGAGALPPEVPAVAFVRSHAQVSEGEARRLLGHFGLEGDAALRPLGRLSPGERARTAIAAMVAAKAELLLLDEPTNHLDFASLEVLEAALRDYPGAIVAVSHDRAFLEAIGTHRRVRVRDGAVVET